MKARTTNRTLAAAALAGLVLTGSACAATPQAASAQPIASSTASAVLASPTAVPATASATAQDSTPAPAAPAAAPAAAPDQGRQSAPVKTFTFPDGHLSFDYPAGWTVAVEQGPAQTAAEGATSRMANITDATGKAMATVYSGEGPGFTGSVTRTILDHSPTDLKDANGRAVEFGFTMDTPVSSGNPSYSMGVRTANEFAGGTVPGSSMSKMPNGNMEALVTFDPAKAPEFATPAAAKAWMGTGEYAQLKTLLLSLSYK
jgi:hypothetical protein